MSHQDGQHGRLRRALARWTAGPILDSRRAVATRRAGYVRALALAWVGVRISETVDQRAEALRHVRLWTGLGRLRPSERLAAWLLSTELSTSPAEISPRSAPPSYPPFPHPDDGLSETKPGRTPP